MKKRILILTFSIALLLIIVVIIFNFTKNKNNDLETNAEETINLDDGLQKEELEELKVDDYRKTANPPSYIQDMDDIDKYYYYKMWEQPGVYKEGAIREEREKIKYYHDNINVAILDMCKKDGDWSLIINKDSFCGFNEKDGLLKDFNYDTIEEIRKEETKGKEYIYVKAQNDKVERTYRLSAPVEDGEIQNLQVQLLEEKNIETNEITNKNLVPFDEENIKSNFEILCRDGEQNEMTGEIYGENIGITDNFRSKYKYFLDLFIHYSPLKYNNITLIELNLNKQLAIFEVDSVLECKQRKYEIKYILDNKKYLDGVEVKMIDEIKYDGNSSNDIFKVVFKNSNWDKIDISNHFREKFNFKDGVFGNINFSNAYFAKGVHKDNNSYLFCLEFDNKEKKYYSFVIVENKEKCIDDILLEELDYGNVSLSVAEELYKEQFIDNDKQ